MLIEHTISLIKYTNIMSLTVASYVNGFQSGVYNPPTMVTFEHGPTLICTPEQHVRYVTVDINPELMKFVIGTSGYYFNAITRASGVSYIWFDKQMNRIEVYGPIWCLDNAEKRLTDRMTHIEWVNIGNKVKQFQVSSWSDEADDVDNV